MLKSSALLLLADPSYARKERHKTLVCVCMRGGLDALTAVVPYADTDYYRVRPKIAVARPGRKDGVLPLDERFGLHPGLADLLPLFAQKQLAVVHATGSQHPTRSHFEAQDYLETGVPGDATLDGWLNRYLALSAERRGPLRAVAMASSMPRALSGSRPAVVIDNLKGFGLPRSRQRGAWAERYGALYAAGNDAVSVAARESLETSQLVRERTRSRYSPDNGAVYPRGGKRFMNLARLMKAGFNVEVAWVELGGWDTHTGQLGVHSKLGRRLALLGKSLAAFSKDLGERMKDVVVITMTEFGRTVAENGAFGTDHGHGTAVFVLGGPVRGGRVYGEWPGLDSAQLYRGRDLAVTTDSRQTLSEICQNHLGIIDATPLFPGFEPARQLNIVRT